MNKIGLQECESLKPGCMVVCNGEDHYEYALTPQTDLAGFIDGLSEMGPHIILMAPDVYQTAFSMNEQRARKTVCKTKRSCHHDTN